MWKLLIVGLIGLVPSCSTARPPAAEVPPSVTVPTVLAISPEIRTNLNILVDQLELEYVACLGGEVRGDTAHITRMEIPAIELATQESVIFRPCDPAKFFAFWHNHPRANAPDKPVGWFCALSITDMNTVIQGGLLFAVVQVDSKHLCWWTRQQTSRVPVSAIRNNYLPKYEGQYDFPLEVKNE